MLTRQLASAGSGKTYTLTKQFIRLFITAPADSDAKDGARRRLRRRPELHRALRGILAVTFTNKATGEMKERIITKLSAIAAYKPLYGGRASLTPEEEINEKKRIKGIDYLDELAKETGEPHEAVARTAAQAIDILLNEFSDFQVSTIDSFFQLVMRTFTYEADLPDNFQIELDADYVAGIGLDSVLIDIHSGRSTQAALYWFARIIEKEQRRNGGWNIYTPGKNTLYSKILGRIKTMESETFKEKLEKLRDYFEEVGKEGDQAIGGKLAEIFFHYETKFTVELKNRAAALKEAAVKVLKYVDDNGIDVNNLAGNLHGRLKKLSVMGWRHLPPKTVFKPDDFRKSTAMKGKLPSDEGLLRLVHIVGDHLEKYIEYVDRTDVKSWIVCSNAFMEIALLWEIKKKIDELMLDANSIRLSDTNTILHRIIGDDETPFIYERLGTRLDHYLIDEFQDTSRLQWVNTLPLLRESESRGEENLIIGDPKQSIYRFRNADSSLITTAVKNEFPNLKDAGNDPKTNTNWRSDLNIVRFNNTLFNFLANSGLDTSSSYGDVLQYSKFSTEDPEKKRGYVKAIFFNNPKNISAQTNDSDDQDDGGESTAGYPAYFPEISNIITDLLRRGFRQKDIAVLVLTHKVGAQVINSFLDFNSRIDPEDPEAPTPIRFISEDSLKVNNARSVRIVIEALKAISGTGHFTRPVVPKESEAEEGNQEPYPKDFEDYSRYADENLPRVSDDLEKMVGEMSAISLPSLVEQIIRTFVPIRIRETEAPFIAAFQDKILEFCEGHLTDPASFLRWWDKRGSGLSISSPESTDAVRITTVHSSKGLEYKAVIIPEATYSFTLQESKEETVWVSQAFQEDAGYPLPPVFPLILKSELEGTFYEPEFDRYKEEVALDRLNAAYVAFTRAEHELYILSKASIITNDQKKEAASFPPYKTLAQGIVSMIEDIDEAESNVPADKRPYVIDEEDLVIFNYGQSEEAPNVGVGDVKPKADAGSEAETSQKPKHSNSQNLNSELRKVFEFTYGSPVDMNEIREREAVKEQEVTKPEVVNEIRSEIVTGYPVNDSLPALHTRIESPLTLIDDGNDIDNDTKIDDGNESQPEGDREVSETDKSDLGIMQSDPGVSEHHIEESEIEEDEIVPGSKIELMKELLHSFDLTEDLERSLLRLKVGGRWSETEMNEIERIMRPLFESEKGREWFFPPKGWKVYSSRPLIHRKRKTRTPDRILISPGEDRAILINFKLTSVADEGEWKQLRAHVNAFRRTGFQGRIEAWLSHPVSGLINKLPEE